MHKGVALWAIPRSTSTASEWMMRRRGGLDRLREPFGEAWHQGEDPLRPRFKEGEKTTEGLTIETVRNDIQTRAAESPVFLKDFLHCIRHVDAGVPVALHPRLPDPWSGQAKARMRQPAAGR